MGPSGPSVRELRSLSAGAPVLRVEPFVMEFDMARVTVYEECLDEAANCERVRTRWVRAHRNWVTRQTKIAPPLGLVEADSRSESVNAQYRTKQSESCACL